MQTHISIQKTVTLTARRGAKGLWRGIQWASKASVWLLRRAKHVFCTYYWPYRHIFAPGAMLVCFALALGFGFLGVPLYLPYNAHLAAVFAAMSGYFLLHWRFAVARQARFVAPEGTRFFVATVVAMALFSVNDMSLWSWVTGKPLFDLQLKVLALLLSPLMGVLVMFGLLGNRKRGGG